LLPCAALLLSSCQQMPEPYAPPVQRQPFENFRPYRIQRVVRMNAPDAPAHFVQDISPASEGMWRWTQQKPTVKIKVRTTENLKYTIDFSLAEATMKDTGPVTLSFSVNGHVLSQVRYEKSGDYHYENPVPPEWLTVDQDVLVAAEIDKMWVSKSDGVKLGFILTRIGLTE
jgi:hypothetical protein